jgi:hypothetical protein
MFNYRVDQVFKKYADFFLEQTSGREVAEKLKADERFLYITKAQEMKHNCALALLYAEGTIYNYAGFVVLDFNLIHYLNFQPMLESSRCLLTSAPNAESTPAKC